MKHLIGVSSNRSIGITTDGDAQVHIELILGIEGGISYKLDGTTVRGEVTAELQALAQRVAELENR